MDTEKQSKGTANEKAGDGKSGRDDFVRPDLGDQLKGAAIGAAIALMLGYAAIQLGWLQGRLVRYALWGAAIGGLLAASDELARAGSRLTKRDTKWLNILVAVIGFVVIFAALVGMVSLAAWIVNSILRPGASSVL